MPEPYSAGMGSNNVILICIGHPTVDACSVAGKEEKLHGFRISISERVMHSTIFRRPVLLKKVSPLARAVSCKPASSSTRRLQIAAILALRLTDTAPTS